jgi:hypothetical protein
VAVGSSCGSESDSALSIGSANFGARKEGICRACEKKVSAGGGNGRTRSILAFILARASAGDALNIL